MVGALDDEASEESNLGAAAGLRVFVIEVFLALPGLPEACPSSVPMPLASELPSWSHAPESFM